MLPVVPRLVSHIDVSSERGWGLIVGEDVWERGLKVTSHVINHHLLAGQRHLLLFEMALARYVAELLNEQALLSVLWVTMYVTLTDIQNGEPV